MLISIHEWPYKSAVDAWLARTNSDLKRMFEQGGVKLCRSEHGCYSLNDSAFKLQTLNLKTKLSEFQFGDVILFGGRKDISRVFLEVMNEAPPDDLEITLYRWLVDNKQLLYNFMVGDKDD